MEAGFSDAAASERRGATLKAPQSFLVRAAAAPGAPTPSSATAADASSALTLAGDRFDEAAAAAAAENPLSRLANQLRKLDAKTRRTTTAAASASAASAATGVASADGGDDASYRSVYCEPGLAYAVYRTLPMRNELDQYLETAAKRRRRGRVPFVDASLPGQSWMKRELRARRPLPNLKLAPPPPVTLGTQASRGLSTGAGAGGGDGGGGGGGGGLGPSRLVRLSTFAEVERQRTVTYELQTKLKEMLARK